MRELITWGTALVFYGLGLGVLQVPNPKRVTAGKTFFVLGALWGIGVTFMWAISTPRSLLFRLIFEFFILGLIGAGTVELFRFANYTEPVSAPVGGNAPMPERADIFTTLVIDSVQNGKVKYHLEIKNGQLPVTITNISSYTSEFLQNEEGPYIPKNLRPGESLSVEGDVLRTALPPDKRTNLAVRIGYNAEIRGTQKGFVSSYRFLVDCPQSPCALSPFSVSHDSELEDADPARTETAKRFALPEGTAFLVLPEKREDSGGPNIVTGSNTERRFMFNPEAREVVFESKAESGRILQVRLPLRETKHPQGLHLIVMSWSGTSAVLGVDGTEAEVHDQKPKTRKY